MKLRKCKVDRDLTFVKGSVLGPGAVFRILMEFSGYPFVIRVFIAHLKMINSRLKDDHKLFKEAFSKEEQGLLWQTRYVHQVVIRLTFPGKENRIPIGCLELSERDRISRTMGGKGHIAGV